MDLCYNHLKGSMGDDMDYNTMLVYVENALKENNALYHSKFSFRNRFKHIQRVFQWCKRIMVDCPNCNREMLLTAAIFHDVGYSYGKKDHAKKSAEIFLKYAVEHDFDFEFMMRTSEIIALHSDKNLIKEKSSPEELVLLLEADLLDEEGALGIVWDLLYKGMNEPKDYMDALAAIHEHSAHIVNQDCMITPLARKYWEEKKELVIRFCDSLQQDLFLKEE